MTEQKFIDWFCKNYPKDTLIHDPAWHALRIYRRAQPASPEGWKLVPCEITPAMRDAWDAAPFSEDLDEEIQGAYRAMIAASPQMTKPRA